jgi:hypothetical protein
MDRQTDRPFFLSLFSLSFPLSSPFPFFLFFLLLAPLPPTKSRACQYYIQGCMMHLLLFVLSTDDSDDVAGVTFQIEICLEASREFFDFISKIGEDNKLTTNGILIHFQVEFVDNTGKYRKRLRGQHEFDLTWGSAEEAL